MIIFAFKNTIAEKVVQNLSQNEVYYVENSKAAINKFLEEIVSINPERILGLGSYSGKDKNEIRIETVCKNKFRNKIIIGNGLEELEINYFVSPSKKLKLAQGIGNSYCNLISFLIMNAIKSDNLKSRYTFLHIPKTFELNLALSSLFSSVEQNSYNVLE